MPHPKRVILDDDPRQWLDEGQDQFRHGRPYSTWIPPTIPQAPRQLGPPPAAFAQEPPGMTPLPAFPPAMADREGDRMPDLMQESEEPTVPIEGMGGGQEEGEAVQEMFRQQEGAGMAPAQAPAAMPGRDLQDRERRTGFMRSLADTDEYLGNLDFTPHARLGVFGIRVPQKRPYQSPGHREAAIEEDRMTDSERQMLSEAFGIQVPPGSRFSRIEKIAPDIAHAIRGGRLTAYQQEQLDLARNRDERAEAREGRQEEYNRRAEEAGERAEYTARQLPAETVEKVAAMDSAIANLKTVRGAIKRRSTGPVEAVWQQLGRYFGISDPAKLKDQAFLQATVAEWMFGTGGKQLTPTEQDILRPAMPSRFDNPAALGPMLDAFEQIAKNRRAKLLGAFKAAGKDVSGFMEEEARSTTGGPENQPTATGGDLIEATDPETGETRLIPRAKAAQARRQGLQVKE